METIEFLPDQQLKMIGINPRTFELRTEKTHIPFGTIKNILPEDRSLAVSSEPPSELCEIWYRFVNFNWHLENGSACIFNSYLLRRILKMHGYSCAVRQVVGFYHNPRRNWTFEVGKISESEDTIATGQLDTHAVVVCNGWILDFSMYRLYQQFGNTAPMAVIVPEEYEKWHEIGTYGHIKYDTRLTHPDTRNEVLTFRTPVIELSQRYFHFYKV
jgi:hypothetical protein